MRLTLKTIKESIEVDRKIILSEDENLLKELNDYIDYVTTYIPFNANESTLVYALNEMSFVKPVIKYANDPDFSKQYLLLEMDRYVVFSLYVALANVCGTEESNFDWVLANNKARNIADNIAVMGSVMLTLINGHYEITKEFDLSFLQSIKTTAFKSILSDPSAQEYISSGYDENKTIENQRLNKKAKSGCYIATCVYGSYYCSEVLILRRYRDERLNKTFLGNLFIRIYYFISPTIVKIFHKNNTIIRFWRLILDKFVSNLRSRGYSDEIYLDKE